MVNSNEKNGIKSNDDADSKIGKNRSSRDRRDSITKDDNSSIKEKIGN